MGQDYYDMVETSDPYPPIPTTYFAGDVSVILYVEICWYDKR